MIPSPIGFKVLAAAAAFGSYAETLALFKSMRDRDPSNLPLLLPAFYTSLDPARISSILARFDSSGWPHISSEISQAHLCLRAISIIARAHAIPDGSFADLWKHVWPWIEFLDEYEDSLSGHDFGDATVRYMVSLVIIRLLHNDEGARPLIDTTPGVYVVVGRAWRHFLREEGDKYGGLFDVSYLLSVWTQNKDWKSSAFKEIVTGSGGTQADLASIVVSHIKYVLPFPDSPVLPQTTIHFIGLVSIVYSKTITGHRHPTFEDALLSAGIVVPLTTALRALCRSPLDNVDAPLKPLFSALVDYISSYFPLWLPESLRTGLLEIMFAPLHREAISPSLPQLLQDVFAPASVYHSVLVQLQMSLLQVRNRNAAAIFDHPDVLAYWQSLIRLFESRFRVLNEYDAGALMVTTACNDFECGEIRPKQELSRCGGCLTVYYCSPACQTNDWRRG
ncbi:hypothetical protein C8R45DRAFT_1101831 [Mycena sanguinolenta]|nr:hypothetical protein C8R45DRAFT_1101831 [Mycena sanguinolenta]